MGGKSTRWLEGRLSKSKTHNHGGQQHDENSDNNEDQVQMVAMTTKLLFSPWNCLLCGTRACWLCACLACTGIGNQYDLFLVGEEAGESDLCVGEVL